MRLVDIWDGKEFRRVPEDEAKQLEKEDKAQLMTGFIGGLDLKYRHQFTGYQTREMRAQEPTVAVEVQEPTTEADDWEAYKDAYKEATGAKRASKKAVIEWMEENGITAE